MYPFESSSRSFLKDKFSSSSLSLPPLPPASTRLENNSILRQESRSAVALAELRMWLQQHHNPKIFVDNLMIREALFSTAIETRLVRFEDVIEALALQASKPGTSIKGVLLCLNAMRFGNNIITQTPRLELAHIFQIAALLQGMDASRIQTTLPAGEPSASVKLLQNLVAYFNEPFREISLLIKMAVQHYQFESIHPFYLENGRTGRILNLIFLRQHNVLPIPGISLSEYILQNKIEYYHLHQQVREQNEWTSWILFLLRGLENAARKTFTQLQAIESLYTSTTDLCQRNAKSVYSKSLVDLIFIRPYCKIEYLREFNIAQRKAAGKYLYALEDLGVLRVKKVGKENVFINHALMELLHIA